jgi:isoquinoline 1-oxidoreductase alpha subunit
VGLGCLKVLFLISESPDQKAWLFCLKQLTKDIGLAFIKLRKEDIMISLNVNGKSYKVDVSEDVPLLWVIRDYLKLTGTKFGCGIGECGACTVHIDGKAERSCGIPVGKVKGKKITTIEGLPENHPVKRAWIKEQVVQCGYCQPGVMMQVAALISSKPKPSADQVINAMDDVICRCGTYPRIKRGIKAALEMMRKEG